MKDECDGDVHVLAERIEQLDKRIDERLIVMEKHLNERMDDQEARNKERFFNAEKTVGLALTSADKAVTKAEEANNKRFDATNEWRETVNDITSRLATRLELENIEKQQKNWGVQTVIMSLGLVITFIMGVISIIKH